MIEVYYAGNTNSGRKTMEWLEKQNLPFIEKKITKNNPFKIEEIMQFLARAENGFDDLINSRAKIFKELEADLNQLSTSDLIDTIVRIPTLVKLPLIVDEKKIVIGYNENELRCFLPAEYRRIQRDSYLFIKKIRV
ncbi:transcriptional regulator Spx [Enterococcus casseliflavus]|nr:regulatory protein spx [Enterococcus casseliflavus]STP33478.1 transcriptional regulator Spx [Enterococcus casseliflavus]